MHYIDFVRVIPKFKRGKIFAVASDTQVAFCTREKIIKSLGTTKIENVDCPQCIEKHNNSINNNRV